MESVFLKSKTIDANINFDNTFIFSPFAGGHSRKLDNQKEQPVDIITFFETRFFYPRLFYNFFLS